MDLHVTPDGVARFGGAAVRCAIGRSGVSTDKREGDGATPIGRFLCRWFYWRADRLPEPSSGLGRRPLGSGDGWCDDPLSPRYNRPVRLPAQERHERLWREDALYDIVVVLGYNDAPAVAGRGSAVFLHAAATDIGPTEGCVALARTDLARYLASATPGSAVIVGG